MRVDSEDFAAELADLLASSGALAPDQRPASVAEIVRQHFGGEQVYIRQAPQAQADRVRQAVDELMQTINGRCSVRELARRLGIGKSTAHRLCQAAQRVVSEHPGKRPTIVGGGTADRPTSGDRARSSRPRKGAEAAKAPAEN